MIAIYYVAKSSLETEYRPWGKLRIEKFNRFVRYSEIFRAEGTRRLIRW